jgi:hypothetical protein
MRKEYDFAQAKKNPHATRLKEQLTNSLNAVLEKVTEDEDEKTIDTIVESWRKLTSKDSW